MAQISTLQKYTLIAMVAFAGIFVFWMVGSGTSPKSPVTKSLMNAKKICVACRRYAFDHDGTFPPSLDALIPTYLPDRSVLASPLMPSEPVGYTYTPPSKNIGAVNAIVIEDKFAPLQHLRIVSYLDGSARVLNIP